MTEATFVILAIAAALFCYRLCAGPNLADRVLAVNGIVLVSHIHELRQRGFSHEEAVTTGCLHRLRPVIMTALTTLLGLLPLAFAQGIGAEVQRPLAIVVIGGVLSSTLLTLVVLPALFRWFEEPSLSTRVSLPSHETTLPETSEEITVSSR